MAPIELMYVLGATKTEHLATIRALTPKSFFLVPGVGAQGGDLESVFHAAANEDIGLLVNSSRSIIFASSEDDYAEAARNAANGFTTTNEKTALMLHYSTHLHPTSKTWVTFVHGAGGSSSIWFKQLREFSKHFNVLLLDLRGHGKSRMQLSNVFKKKYTFDVLAEDIIAVLDKENIKSSHFVGISLGTILIRQIGEMYPQRVQSMVMAGPS